MRKEILCRSSYRYFRRLNDHCTQNNPGIDNAISELGSDKFSFRILEIVHHAEDLDTCESKWINYYKELYGDEQMYNIAQTTNSRTTIDSQIKAQIKNYLKRNLVEVFMLLPNTLIYHMRM